MDKAVMEQARHPADHFRAALLTSVLRDQLLDAKTLAPHVTALAALAEDSQVFCAMDAGEAIDEQAWVKMVLRHGWIARAVKAHRDGWKSKESAGVRNEAMRTLAVIAGGSMLGLGLLLTGVALLLRMLFRLGQVRFALPRAEPVWAGPLVMGFAIYLAAYAVGLGLLLVIWPAMPKGVAYAVALVFVLIGMLWPRWRGMSAFEWRQQLGLHRGEGVWREMGAGIAGWVTGLPLLACGAMLAPVITRLTGDEATHPIVDQLVTPGWGRVALVALAVVWAPVTEEVMFRGLLFPGLAARWHWLFGALGSAVIFAVVHPQGWAGVPAITAIALTMCWLRATRGSLIAPMTAHALNNGLITLLMLSSM